MPIEIKKFSIDHRVEVGGPHNFFLIAGPCVIESEKHAFFLAESLKGICSSAGIPYIFKASFDKANRSSLRSYRGPGLEDGIKILGRIKSELKIPVLSDVHETSQINRAAEILDVIQIPAFLCRQTDLILEVAKTNKVMNIKKGQFMSPYDMKNVIDKIQSTGNDKIILTERGTSFGYNNLVFDIRSIPIMQNFGFPVVVDATHSVQKPGGLGGSSGGNAEFIPHIAKAGISAGADGLFLEVHDNPSQALSDGSNSFILNDLTLFLDELLRIKKAIDPEYRSLIN
jgi:2-dehydro-3-deoxyphosphooctonate aldolase (KDO 8-P synthase)